jgi:glycosyltransferase involved in cell wall biosynthesis
MQVYHNNVRVVAPPYHKNQEKINRDFTKLTFLTIGNLVKIKGFREMMVFFEKLNQKTQEWTWRIIGNGPLENTLRLWVKQNGLQNNVVIIPEVYKKDLLNEYKNSNYYIQLSHRETFGVTPLEAYYFQCKLIVSGKIPSLNEVNGDNIFTLNNNYDEIINIIMN